MLRSERFSPHFATLVALSLFALGLPVSFAWSQDLAKGEALIQRALAEGTKGRDQDNRRARHDAEDTLDELAKLAAKGLDKDASCATCAEQLLRAYFMRSYFGYEKDYDECLKFGAQAMARFPGNGRIAVHAGTAFYNTGKYGDAIRAFKRYQSSTLRDAQTDMQVANMLRDSEARFQSGWYRHADFYQSGEARIEKTNLLTFKSEVLFQVTPEWETGLGNQFASGLAKHGPPLQDPGIIGYLDQLVSRLVKASPGPTFTYRISMYDSAEVNAMALPGQVAVSSGLLKFVESESELAAVLSHELAHTYGHHAARAAIKQYHAKALAGAAVAAVSAKGAVAQTVTAVAGTLAVDIFSRAYSRFEESEADTYAAHILYNAGYNPTALSQMQLRMYQRNPKQPIKFLSTHPPAPDRVEAVTAYLEAFSLERELALDSATFQKIVKQRDQPAAVVVPAAQPTSTRVDSPAVRPPAALPAAASLPAAAAMPKVTVPTADALPPASGARAARDGGGISIAPGSSPGLFTAAPPAVNAPRVPDTDPFSRVRGEWTTRAGDLAIRLASESGALVGHVQRVTGPWAGRVQPGDPFFMRGRSLGPASIGGESMSLGPAGCSMSIKYAPATLTLDADGSGLTITATEFRASAAPACQWIAELETKTYTLYRVVAR